MHGAGAVHGEVTLAGAEELSPSRLFFQPAHRVMHTLLCICRQIILII